MTLKEALRRATEILSSQSIDEVYLDAELLLRHVLGLGRAQLYAQLEQNLPSKQTQTFFELVQRRIHHEPIAYIIEHREFFDIDFYIDYRVLIPRPESELLVEKSLDFVRAHFPSPDNLCLVADIGTGCGAIAISLALHLPQVKVYATDISTDALQVATLNCLRHGVNHRVRLLKGDMLHPLPEPVDLIVANLPYVKEEDLERLSPEIKLFEPRQALSGGCNGLDNIRQLLSQAGTRLLKKGAIFAEIGPGQGKVVTELARKHLPQSKVELIPDLAGKERVASIET